MAGVPGKLEKKKIGSFCFSLQNGQDHTGFSFSGAVLVSQRLVHCPVETTGSFSVSQIGEAYCGDEHEDYINEEAQILKIYACFHISRSD